MRLSLFKSAVFAAAVAACGLVASSANAQVVISQLYTGGGSGVAGTTYLRDYVELFNNSNTAVSLATYSVQYASATGVVSSQLALTGSLAAKSFYLIEVGQAGTVGGTSPVTPNQSSGTGVLSLSNTGGKVILANTTTNATFTTGSQTYGAGGSLSANVVDFVGYGTGNAFEGTGTAPAPSNTTTSIIRNSTGSGSTLTFLDTNNNSVDFTIGAPNLRSGAAGGVVVPEANTFALIAPALGVLGLVVARRRKLA
jgi:hypothetical protein